MAALIKLVHFSKKSGSSVMRGPEILAFGSHCSAKFEQILDCFIPNFKLKYEDLENIKTHHVDIVVFKLHQIKQRKFFRDTLVLPTEERSSEICYQSSPSIFTFISFYVYRSYSGLCC